MTGESMILSPALHSTRIVIGFLVISGIPQVVWSQLDESSRQEDAVSGVSTEQQVSDQEIATADTSPIPRATPQEVGLDPERLVKVHEVMQRFVDDGAIAGSVVAVARNGKLVLMDTVGYQSIEDKIPMSADSIFRIYSMSKPVTSVAAMLLVDRGKIKLDDPVAKYIPCFEDVRVFAGSEGEDLETDAPRRAVTIRDLLRHTAGLTYGFFGNSKVDQLYRQAGVLADEDDCAALCEKVAAIPLTNQPGDRFQYGVSVDVLGRVIEIASGKTLDEFFREEIFEPLKMADTGFFVPEEKVPRMTVNYAANPEGGLSVADDPADSRFTTKPKMLSGGGGLVSTAGDYLRFAQMVANGGQLDGRRILKEETVVMMTKDQLPSRAFPIGVGAPMPGVGFGLGFSVVVDRAGYPHPVEGEYGWDGMASTHYFASPGEGFIVVALTQRLPFSPQVENAIKPIIYSAIVD
ncbi:MAG: serine hydrolase domain-containing protein [Rubripirellula sp.]